jgi:hypothetical protein
LIDVLLVEGVKAIFDAVVDWKMELDVDSVVGTVLDLTAPQSL